MAAQRWQLTPSSNRCFNWPNLLQSSVADALAVNRYERTCVTYSVLTPKIAQHS